MTPTVQLDTSFRPVTVPDHFIAFQTTLSVDKLTCTITFLRQRIGDATAWELIAARNAQGSKFISTSPSVSFSHSLLRAPAKVDATYDIVYKRDSLDEVWVRVDDDQWTKLLRMYADETMDESARE